jgi:hypothetical protein
MTYCSGELFNKKFIVPCDPLVIVEADYGKGKWKMPQESDYKFMNMEYRSDWSDEDWPHAIKFYEEDSFNKKYTLGYLNDYVKGNDSKITDIDDNDDEF